MSLTTFFANSQDPSAPNNSLAIWALIVAVLSAVAAGGVVWQTWRYHPRPAWVAKFQSIVINDTTLLVVKFVNRGSLEATDVTVWAGARPGPRDMHANALAAAEIIPPNELLSVTFELPLKSEGGFVYSEITLTWRHHPRPEKPRAKTFRLIDFEWTAYRWGKRQRANLAKPPKYLGY